MSKQTVFLLGATGETGAVILDALLEDGSFEVTCFIRTASAGKPATQKLKDRGLKVVTGDIAGPQEELVAMLRGIDTVIAALYAPEVRQQIPLIDAAVAAGVKRFVPCSWAPPAPRGSVMWLRDLKEEVNDHIFRARLGFTIIDAGFWHQLSFMTVPSGKLDYAAVMPTNTIVGDGTTPNMFADKVDIGKISVRIIKDKRTLNKRVFINGETLNQNQIRDIIERKTGEKVKVETLSAKQATANVKSMQEQFHSDPKNVGNMFKLIMAEYLHCRYVRGDNSPESAEYLGYIDSKELYPDYKFITFSEFADELIAGRAQRPYPQGKL